MASPESRRPNLVNALRVGAVLILASCSSVPAPEVSATIGEHNILNIAGQASIVPYPNDVFLIFDLLGGLAPKDSIAKAKRYMKNVGCNIVNSRSEKSMGKTIGESVLVQFPCLPGKK